MSFGDLFATNFWLSDQALKFSNTSDLRFIHQIYTNQTDCICVCFKAETHFTQHYFNKLITG